MSKGESFLIQPGTLLLIIVIGLILLGLINWASDAIEVSGEKSLEEQQNAIVCSNLEVDFVDRGSNETHQEVYVQVNQPVEELIVEFYGDGNHTSKVENVGENSITKTSAPLESVSEVQARARGCDRVFG